MPARTATRPAQADKFTEEDAYQTWRVIARNPQYTGETEGIGFSNGVATISGLPKSVKCSTGCEAEGDLCRLHLQVRRLNNLRNYPVFVPTRDARTNKRVPVKVEGYRVLSEAEYEQEFGEANDSDIIDLDDF
jgi:hypothetical protein